MGWTAKQCQDIAETAILGKLKPEWTSWETTEADVLAYLREQAAEETSGRAADSWGSIIDAARRALRKAGLVEYQSVRTTHKSGREVLGAEWRIAPMVEAEPEPETPLAKWAKQEQAIVDEVQSAATVAVDFLGDWRFEDDKERKVEVVDKPLMPGGGEPVLRECQPLRGDGTFLPRPSASEIDAARVRAAMTDAFPVPSRTPEPLPAPGTAEAIEAARALLEDALARLDLNGPLQAALDALEQYNRLAPVVDAHRQVAADSRTLPLPHTGTGSARIVIGALRDALRVIQERKVATEPSPETPAPPTPAPPRPPFGWPG